MQKVIRRLDRLDEIFNPPRRPHKVLRVVVSGVCSPATLANSTCKRTLHNGTVTEIVTLDGSTKNLTDEEIERFVQSFPIEEATRW